MSIARIFTQHPEEVGETYGQHARAALGFFLKLQVAALAALVHALLPFACVKTASTIIRELAAKMSSRTTPETDARN
jgi:hypothetical protein